MNDNLNENKEPFRPLYGEYDPELAAQIDPELAAEVESQSGQAVSPETETSKSLVGVPHNLGVKGESGGQQYQHNTVQPASQSAADDRNAQKPDRRTDRIFTVVLLVLSTFGVLNLALSALNLGSQLHLLADAAGLESFELAPSITIIESVATISILSIFAISLLWSVHRLRTRKVAFWVPLSAGILAFVVLTIFSAVALFQSPELMNSITPETLDNLFKNLS